MTVLISDSSLLTVYKTSGFKARFTGLTVETINLFFSSVMYSPVNTPISKDSTFWLVFLASRQDWTNVSRGKYTRRSHPRSWQISAVVLEKAIRFSFLLRLIPYIWLCLQVVSSRRKELWVLLIRCDQNTYLMGGEQDAKNTFFAPAFRAICTISFDVVPLTMLSSIMRTFRFSNSSLTAVILRHTLVLRWVCPGVIKVLKT